MGDRTGTVEAVKGRLGAMDKGAAGVGGAARLSVWLCAVFCLCLATGTAQNGYRYATPPLTPPPPGGSYGTGTGSWRYAQPSSAYSGSSYYQQQGQYGYPGSSYGTRQWNPNTGAFGATGRGAGYVTPSSSRYGQTSVRGRATPTPRGAKATPTPRGWKGTPTPRGATPGAGQGPLSTRLLPGQTPMVIRGGMPVTPMAGAAAPRASVVSASFSFKPAPDVAVVYITPLQAKLAVGEEFDTRLSLSNPGKKEFESIDVVLRFDPDLVEPIRLDDDAAQPLLDGRAEAVVHTQAGILIYRARLAQPTTMQAAEFFTIRWKTLAVSPHTEIGFASWRGQRTALLDKSNATILGGTGNEGSLGMTLQVYSPDELIDGPPMGEELFAGAQRATRGGIRLRLVTNKREIPANEDFYVGVWLENPRLLDVSKVNLKIRFDPRVLEVADDDANNWITNGVNIFDGDYHEDFPFDIHVENSVENEVGLATYAVASTQRRVAPEHGYLARIRFRPKALGGSTRIELALEPDDDPMRTQVSHLGADLLGEPDRSDDGVENLTVRITAPQLPRLLATEK